MLNVTDVSVDFGTRILFDKLTFTVKPTDKIGLAGRNGAGKSTLLKIIAGVGQPTSGRVSYPSNYEIGYLPQELHITSEETVFNEAKSALGKLEELEKRQEYVTEQITTRTDYESDSYMDLIEELNKVNDLLHYFDGQNVDKRVGEILKGLGFTQEDLEKPIKSFSGGWQMRVELAKLLLMQPDLILLDEPTNHLDIESILWLETFLKSHKGAIIMVSHDRQFLDAITNRTVEIINNKIEDYKAPYSKFLQLREERVEKLLQAQKNQEKEIAQLESNISKFKAKASKAKFAQSLQKRLDKMDRIEIDNYDKKDMNLRFNVSRRSGEEVVVAEGVSKSYGNKKVIKHLDLKVHRGDRIAFVGKNGMGKSTLAKIIVGELEAEGEITLGHNVDLGYYAQHQSETLDKNRTLLDTIEQAAPKELQGKERSILGAFLFSGEDVEKKVQVLSGGEKARLALAKMMMFPINFLVLDEPTNHLDLQSKAVLKEAVMNFEGTLICVSHDRDFLTDLTDMVYEFTDDGITQHLGDVQEFLKKRKVEDFRAFEQSEETETKVEKNEPKATNSRAERKEVQKQISRLEKKINSVEKEIFNNEQEVEQINAQLKDTAYYEEKIKEPNFFQNYEEKKATINQLYKSYDELMTEVQKLKLKL